METKRFITAPVMAIQGRIDDRARARRHDLEYARTKPVTNAARKLTTRATFSDVPCWTKSNGAHEYFTLFWHSVGN